MVRPPFYGVPQNPWVTEMSQQRGGRGVVDVGCGFVCTFPRQALFSRPSRATRKAVLSMIVLVTGRFAV